MLKFCHPFTLVYTFLGLGIATALSQNPTPLLTQSADRLIAILNSEAPRKEKADACRELAVIGSKEAVAALAGLLSVEPMNHMARQALETIPDPSVDVALRTSLATLRGRSLVGVIGSVGVRRDSAAVNHLARLLQDPDNEVAQASARALGNIANLAAVEALQRASATASLTNQLAFCEGLFRCAEALLTQGEQKQAVAIYDHLRTLSGLPQVRAGALRGAVLSRGAAGLNLFRESLRSRDPILFATAIRIAYEFPGLAVSRTLAGELSRLGDDDQLVVVQALGKRPDSASVSALSSMAKKGSKALRIAALQALAETGNPTTAIVLVEFVGSSEREIAQAAIDSLAGLKGKGVEAQIEALLRHQIATFRVAGMELIARRRMMASLPELVKATADPDAQVRPSALAKVGELGGAPELAALLDGLPHWSAAADLDAAEQALTLLCARSNPPESATKRIIHQLPQMRPVQKCVLLGVLGNAGGSSALRTIRAAVDDSNPDVHRAAIRALGAGKSAEVAPILLSLAKEAESLTDRKLCLQSYLGLAANGDVGVEERLAMCRQATDLVKGAEEKRLLLGALGQMDSTNSVALIHPYLDDAAVREEASIAVLAIAERSFKGKADGPLAATLIPSLEKVAQATGNQDLAQRAKALLEPARKRSSQ